MAAAISGLIPELSSCFDAGKLDFSLFFSRYDLTKEMLPALQASIIEDTALSKESISDIFVNDISMAALSKKEESKKQQKIMIGHRHVREYFEVYSSYELVEFKLLKVIVRVRRDIKFDTV